MRIGLAARAAGVTLGSALALVPMLAVAGTPVETGCPASAELTALGAFDPSVYRLPFRLDDPANGGNGDGWICAFPLPDAMRIAQGVEHTIYQLYENNLKAKGRP
jgi:hypothetical protein